MKKESESCCNNQAGLVSVILGIVGLVGSIVVIPAVISIVSLIFGIVQYRKAKNSWAFWGIILGVLGIVIAVLVLMGINNLISSMQETMSACLVDPTLPGCDQILQAVGAAA